MVLSLIQELNNRFKYSNNIFCRLISKNPFFVFYIYIQKFKCTRRSNAHGFWPLLYILYFITICVSIIL